MFVLIDEFFRFKFVQIDELVSFKLSADFVFLIKIKVSFLNYVCKKFIRLKFIKTLIDLNVLKINKVKYYELTLT